MDMDFLLTQKMRMGDEKAVEAFVTKYYVRYCGTAGYASGITGMRRTRLRRPLSGFSEISVSTVITAGQQIICM